MKKALALVLALVLALSMGVSAFAALVELEKVTATDEDPTEIVVINLKDDSYILYTRPFMPLWDDELTDKYVTYFAIDPEVAYKDIKLTANGNISAELVDYDPETMVAVGALNPTYEILVKGKNVTEDIVLKETVKGVELDKYGKVDVSVVYAYDTVNIESYDDAKTIAKLIKDEYRLSSSQVKVVCEQNVNIVKLTVENNFSAHYTEGTLKIEATYNKKAYSQTLTVINDVSIFEYEEVKYAAENNADGAYLQLGAGGYSDYITSEIGYDKDIDDIFGNEYDEDLLRKYPFALVVSTTAFRAIEGEDLTVAVVPSQKINGEPIEISVTLKDVAKGQKGINFFAWGDYTFEDKDDDGVKDLTEDFETISFGFKGNQVVKGKFEVVVELPYTYYDLRELFGIKVEEDDIIPYYIVDENGKVVGGKEVDYMTADLTENVKFVVEGENQKLGYYTLTLEVPANESGEANPNTGAESVVGVVAALAVVSVATAAAVSLKK